MKRIMQLRRTIIAPVLIMTVLSTFISCAATTPASNSSISDSTSFSSCLSLGAGLTGLMTFESNGQSLTRPTGFSVPPVPISWMAGIFSGQLEEASAGEEDVYQVHGSLSPDGAWIETMFFSLEKGFTTDNTGTFFRVTLQNVPLLRSTDESGNIELLCAKEGPDVQRYVTEIEYAEGPLSGNQNPSILSEVTYVSTDWNDSDCVANLKVTLAFVSVLTSITGTSTPVPTMGGSTPAMQRIIIYDERTAIVLGIFTLFELLAVFFSCRTCVTIPKRMKLVNLMNIGVYRKFYRYHSYYWWVFQVLLASHFLMVVMQIGMQKTGIIDFPTFLAVMILGLGAAITALTLLVSCRIMPRLITAATSKKPMDSARFRMFSMRHDYYWGIVWLLALAHFTVSYIHIGVWPR